MLKGKKLSGGRAEVTAANYTFYPAQEAPEEVHHGVIEAVKDDTDLPDCNCLARAFVQELSTFKISLLKSHTIAGAHLREKNYHDLREEVDYEVARTKRDIEALKGALEESRVKWWHKEECEAIRRLVAMQPPQAKMQRSIGELEIWVCLWLMI